MRLYQSFSPLHLKWGLVGDKLKKASFWECNTQNDASILLQMSIFYLLNALPITLETTINWNLVTIVQIICLSMRVGKNTDYQI